MGVGLTGLYYRRHTNYHHASRLCRVLFFTKPGVLHWATPGCESFILLVVSQQTSCWLLHALRASWPCFFHLERSVGYVLTADLSARTVVAGRLLIARSNIDCDWSAYPTFCVCTATWCSNESMTFLTLHTLKTRTLSKVSLQRTQCCICQLVINSSCVFFFLKQCCLI